MKIALLIDSLGPGGKERQFFYLVKNLSKNYTIIVVVLNSEVFYSEIGEYCHQLVLIDKDERYKLKTISKIKKKLKAFDPDVFHIWSNIIPAILFPYLLINRKKVITSTIRYADTTTFNTKQNLIKKLSFFSSAIIVANSKKGLEVEKLTDSKKGRVIYNGIESITRPKKEIPKEYKKGVINVGMIGRFQNAKDFESFIKAAEIVLRNKENIIFFCIGDGQNFQRTKESAIEIDSERIVFTGLVKNTQDYIDKLDIGVLLTDTNGHAEGMSNVIMEYMNASIPVIATNAGGTPEVIINGEHGFLVEPFNVQQIAEKIEFLIDNINLSKEMGKKAKQRIETVFSNEKMTDEYISLYKSIAK